MPEFTHAEGLQRISNVQNHNTEAAPTPMPIIQHHLAKHFVVNLCCLCMFFVALPCAIWKKEGQKNNSAASSRIAQRSAAAFSLSTEGVVESHLLEKCWSLRRSSKVSTGKRRLDIIWIYSGVAFPFRLAVADFSCKTIESVRFTEVLESTDCAALASRTPGRVLKVTNAAPARLQAAVDNSSKWRLCI